MPTAFEAIKDLEEIEELIDQLVSGQLKASELSNHTQFGEQLSAFQHQVTASRLDSKTLASLEAMVNTHKQPCFVTDQSGRIVRANGAATALLDLSVNDHIDEVGLVGRNGTTLSQEIAQAHERGTNIEPIRLSIGEAARGFTLYAAPIQGTENFRNMCLIFGQKISWENDEVRAFISSHDLTPSEDGILFEFVSGLTLREIAESRSVSLSTIRSQFYAITQKFGVRSQQDLIREIYAVSNFVASARNTLEKSQHPNRRTVSVLRPGGRSVEVILAGDFQGLPVVSLNSPSFVTFSSIMEAAFAEQGIFSISIIRPGYGATSPESAGVDYYDTVAGDVQAVLGQLEIEQCILFATGICFRCAVVVADILRPRILEVITYNISYPNHLYKGESVFSNVLSKLDFAVLRTDPVRMAFFKLFIRAAQLSGTERVLRLIFRHDREALAAVMVPEVFREIDQALHVTFSQGAETVAKDYERKSFNWLGLLSQSTVPISCIDPDRKDLSSNSVAEKFKSEYSARIRFLPYSGPEMTVEHTDTDFMCELVRGVFRG